MNTDRLSFLRSILDEPADNVRRLVFADWLDEHSTDDVDLATAEFIRLSCGREVQHDKMPREAYKWLADNWQRLVPDLVAILPQRGRQVWIKQLGRTVTLKAKPINLLDGKTRHVTLEFWRGFLARADFYRPLDFHAFNRVWRNQPMAAPTMVPPYYMPSQFDSFFPHESPFVDAYILPVTWLGSGLSQLLQKADWVQVQTTTKSTWMRPTGCSPWAVRPVSLFAYEHRRDDPGTAWERMEADVSGALVTFARHLAGYPNELFGRRSLPRPAADSSRAAQRFSASPSPLV